MNRDLKLLYSIESKIAGPVAVFFFLLSQDLDSSIEISENYKDKLYGIPNLLSISKCFS